MMLFWAYSNPKQSKAVKVFISTIEPIMVIISIITNYRLVGQYPGSQIISD